MKKEELRSSIDEVIAFTCKEARSDKVLRCERIELIKALAKLIRARALIGTIFLFTRNS